MALTLQAASLAEHCKRGLRPLYALVGDEALLALEAADLLRSTAREQGFDERAVYTVDPYFKWDLLAQATASKGLFSTRKIIEVRMPSGKPGRDGGEGLMRWCELADKDTLGILSLPKPDGTTRNSQWWGKLAQTAVIVSCDTIGAAEMPRFLQARLRAAGLSASEEALAFLSSRVEGNLIAAHQEIQKLAALAPGQALTLEHLQDALTKLARYEVDGLGDAILAGHAARLLRVLEGLEGEGESPVVAHFALQQLTRQLAAVAQALSRGQPLALALREAMVWGPRQALFERLVQRRNASLDSTRLRELIVMASSVDLICKGLPQAALPNQPWAALRTLALALLDASSGKPALGLRA